MGSNGGSDGNCGERDVWVVPGLVSGGGGAHVGEASVVHHVPAVLENVLGGCSDGGERAKLLRAYYGAVAACYGAYRFSGFPGIRRVCTRGDCSVFGAGLVEHSNEGGCKGVGTAGTGLGADSFLDVDVVGGSKPDGDASADGRSGGGSGGSALRGVCGSGVGGLGGKVCGPATQLKRGPNYARNQASRERKKQAKASRRGTAGDPSGSGERKGFFSECDESLQQELRESRARMLILENERKAVQYARDVARMKSPAQLAIDVVDLVRRTRDDPKSGADPRIMGWAKTVVSAEVESVAKSAPSSVPSLESVILSESEGSRASEYKRRYEELVLAYDNADCFNPGDRVDDFRLLQVEFADVVKGDVRTANRFEFAREMQVAIAEAASGGEYACSRAVESLIASAFRSGAD